jgi:hypothetical protein
MKRMIVGLYLVLTSLIFAVPSAHADFKTMHIAKQSAFLELPM